MNLTSANQEICLAMMRITDLIRRSNRCSDRSRIDPEWSETTLASSRCKRDVVAQEYTTIHLYDAHIFAGDWPGMAQGDSIFG